MCGINGFVNFELDKGNKNINIDKMNKIILHRGPNDIGTNLAENYAIGHVRLSILDLSENGHQPMEFGEIKITYNGEVYNFEDIKKKLEYEGYKFNSKCDTEVILKSYAHNGIDFLNDLNGMFAMAIIDKKINKLFLIRDRLGIKPCYYYYKNNQFIFSSEQKAILQCDNLNLTIDKESILEYLTYLYIPNPNTMFNEIKQVKPGHYLELDLKTGELLEKQYWEVNLKNNENKQLDQIVLNLDNELQKSVKLQMISDVSVGAFLSGGVDSSLICGIASKYTQNNQPLKTYSIAYKGEGKYFDETEYALRVSEQYKTEHTVFEVSYKEIFDDLKKMIFYLDNPCADTSVFLNYFISERVKKEVSVCLSGLGGDELFGGYNRYQALVISRRLEKIPKIFRKFIFNFSSLMQENRTSNLGNRIRKLRKLLSSVEESYENSYRKIINYAEFDLKREKKIVESDDYLNSILKFDLENYMVDDLLMLSDKMSMAHGLELRVPFLDHNLVEYAFRISSNHKTSLKEKKIVLKKLAERYIPKDIIYRRKQGFAAPIEVYLKTLEFEKLKLELLENKYIIKYLRKDYIEDVLDNFFSKHRDYSLQVYSLIVLKEWFELFGEKINEDFK